MKGLQPVLNQAKQNLQALYDARKSGDYQTERAAVQQLRMDLESVEQTGYDEEDVELVEAIREALKA